MAIAARFRHSITISRWTGGASTDARGHRNDGWVDDDAPTRGNIQRRSSRELADENGNLEVSDAIGFLALTETVTGRDRLKLAGSTYAIVGGPRDAGGRGRHLELDLRVVVP